MTTSSTSSQSVPSAQTSTPFRSNPWLVGVMVLVHVSLLLWSALVPRFGWSFDSMLAPSSEVLIRAGGLHLESMFERLEIWRLLSCAFLHGPWFHLLLNMLALISIGRMGEGLWGTRSHLNIFVVSAIGSSLLSMAVVESPLVVGASGAIFGLGAALIMELRRLTPTRPELLSTTRSLTRQIGSWLVLGLVATLWADLPISAYGHLGGAISGALIWAALRHHKRRALCWVGLVLWLGVCAAGWNARWRPEQYAILRGLDAAQRDDCSLAAKILEPWIESRDDDPLILNAWAYCETLAMGDLEKALRIGRQALALEPEDPNIMDTVGWTLCRMGRVDEGRVQLQRAVEASEGEVLLVEHLNQCATAGLETGAEATPRQGS